mgnify:CR=1 FL=1
MRVNANDIKNIKAVSMGGGCGAVQVLQGLGKYLDQLTGMQQQLADQGPTVEIAQSRAQQLLILNETLGRRGHSRTGSCVDFVIGQRH